MSLANPQETTPDKTGYLPSEIFRAVQPRLETLGAEAISDQVREWSADAERHQPYVKSYNVWGKRYDVDKLVTSEGWKQLGKWGAKHGFVSLFPPLTVGGC